MLKTEEKLVQGLRLVVEAFAEIVSQNINNNKDNAPATVDVSKDETFKRKEAAEYLQITDNFLYTLTRAGKIKHFRAGNRYLYKKSDLDEWIKNETKKGLKEEI
mgnify:CR=1 FL=1